MDAFSIAKDFGLPLGGAILGWIVTSYRVKSRVEKVETSFIDLKAKVKEDFESQKKEVDRSITELKAGLGLAFQSHKQDIESGFGTVLADIKKVEEDLKKLDDDFERYQRASSHDFARDEEFTNFMEEVNKQWQQIHRTLGRIEGSLK